jgi:hypothetical protein
MLINPALGKSLNENENTNENTYENTNSLQRKAFNEKEARRYAKFAKMSICAKKPLKKHCKECLKTTSDGFKMFFFFEYKISKNIAYKFFIQYNDKLKKIVISFGAPSVSNHVYIKKLYAKGLVLYRLYKIRIEKEFKKIYFKKLKEELHKKVRKIMKSGRKAYQFVFTGYSLGASIAVLASYDLVKSNIINRKINDPTVFSYGGLRIGDAKFIEKVNKIITIWKIVKQNDYIIRTPNCYYSIRLRRWRCYSFPVLRRLVYLRRFPLKKYYIKYIRPIYLRSRRLLLLRNKSFIENNSEIKSLVNEEKSKILLEKNTKKNLSNKTETETKTEVEIKADSLSKYKKNTKAKVKNTKSETKKRTKLVNTNTIPNTNSNINNHYHNHNRKVIARIYRNPTVQVAPVMRRHVLIHTPVFKRRIPIIRKHYVNYNNYFRYIYYSQPLGIQIFYNSSMTSYTVCSYVNGIPSCELKYKLPITFSSNSHNTYYNIDFSSC